MKRTLSVLLVFAFVCGLAVAAFAAPIFVNIGTGSPGGTYYPVGSGMAAIWNRVIPDMRAAAQSTGGTRQNIQLIGTGDCEAGFTDGLYYFAFNGMRDYQGNAQSFLRGLAPLYPEPIHFIAAAGSGITSVKDIKGKRIAIGAVGSGIEMTARALLKDVLGIDPDKDIRAQNLGMGESASALADKNIDAAFMMGGVGSAAVVEVLTMRNGYLVALENDVVAGLNKVLPYYTAFAIPADSYAGQTEPLKTSATWNILSVHEKLDTDAVYAMTKALFDNKADLVNVATVMRFMEADRVGVIQIPLHPGAEKYFKEVGAIK